VVDALGPGATDVAVGDEVAALLPTLGGYAEYAVASSWTPKPAGVSWAEAAALPSSAEARRVRKFGRRLDLEFQGDRISERTLVAGAEADASSLRSHCVVVGALGVYCKGLRALEG
jgi:NADPH:quinone reductase-like Zn-dependent oxidoreductase